MLEQIKQLPLQPEDRAFIKSIEAQAKLENVTLGVFGSFSVGKSALINELLEQRGLLPTHTNETTALPTYIVGGDTDCITTVYFDGHEEMITREQLQQLKAGGNIENIEYVHIQCQSPDWLTSFTVIDTPGRNTKYQAHIDASEQALTTSDAVIYVMPWQGLTLEDVVYIKHILRYQPNLCFVINKVDEVNEAQGVSIEELKMHVAQNLREQLGKDYPLFTVSAKTGFNLQNFKEGFVADLKKNAQAVKKQRLQHALTQFLKDEQQRVSQQVAILTEALSHDEAGFEDKKRELALQREQVELEVSQKVSTLHNALEKIEIEAESFVKKHYQELEKRLMRLATSELAIDELVVQLEDQIVTTRNLVFEQLQQRVQDVTNEEIASTLQQLNLEVAGFQLSEPNLEQLEMHYELAKNKHIKRIEETQEQLNMMLPAQNNEAQRQHLEQEVQELSKRVAEVFVPKMIKDPTFDPDRAKKIAGVIGFVGDIGVSVAAAVATSGATAAAQVGGKLAGKEAAKAAAKVALKKTATELAEKTVVAGLQAASSEKKSAWVAGAQALDKMTSPVQTIATKIGTQIDEGRQQPEKEDLHHRRAFFANKLQIETERDERLAKLRDMEEKATANEQLQQQLTTKREKLKQQAETKLADLEKAYEQEKISTLQQHRASAISQHIATVLKDEEQQLNEWFNLQFSSMLHVIKQMVPAQFDAQLDEWHQQLTALEQLKNTDLKAVETQLAAQQTTLAEMNKLIEGSLYELHS